MTLGAWALLIGLVALMLVGAAFFSAAETSLTSIRRERVHTLCSQGVRRARIVAALHERMDHMMSALLLGNNFFNLAASALATAVSMEVFGHEGVMYATVVMTVLVLVFAEVLPKTYALYRAESVALALAPLVHILVRILYPLVAMTQGVVGRTLAVLGAHTTIKATQESRATLRGVIELEHREGTVPLADKEMLAGVLDLAQRPVSAVMAHRTTLETLNLDAPLEELMAQIFAAHHTRLPCWRTSPDNIVGILHLRHVLKALRCVEGVSSHAALEALMMPPVFILEHALLRDQLHAFRHQAYHLALVLDEYGTLQGLITVEDIVNNVVGPMPSKTPTALTALPCTRLPDGGILLDGAARVHVINRILGWQLSEDEADTVAGLWMYAAERVPELGATAMVAGRSWSVIKMEGKRIYTVYVQPNT